MAGGVVARGWRAPCTVLAVLLVAASLAVVERSASAEPAAAQTVPVLAVNLNGSAATVDGVAFTAEKATADLAVTGRRVCSTTQPTNPPSGAVDLLRCFVWEKSTPGVTVTASGLAAGQYSVFVWVFEDNASQRFDVLVNGVDVADVVSGAAGTWQRVGPLPATIAPGGSLQLGTRGGDANLSAFEVHPSGSTAPTTTTTTVAPTTTTVASTTTTTVATTTTTTTAAAPVPGRPTPADWTGAPFSDALVVSGLQQSLSAEFLPDGRMLVLGKRGTVTVVDPATGAKSDVVTVPSVNSDGERGALDLVASPAFAADRQFFVYYSGTDYRMHVDRFTLGSPSETAASRTRLWSNPGPLINQTSTSHLGGSLNFGPDGMLYISIGDTNQAANSQDLSNVFGKVLRIRRDGTVPGDNPFADGAGPNVDEIWAYGLRNPFRASVDAVTGLLWLGDVGGNYHKNAYEEINVVSRGANYGWPLCEGPLGPPKNGANCPAGVTGPVSFYSHDPDLKTGENASITGGEVYRGNRYSPLQDAYVYADYARRQIRYGTLASASTMATDGTLMSTGDFQPTWLGAGPDGTIYYVHFGYSGSTGQVRRLEWSGATSRPPVIASATASPTSGPTPLDVTFTGSASDPDGTPVAYRWTFGDGASADGATVTHTYTTAGRFEAHLEVTSGGDTVRSAIVPIQAGSPPTATITSPSDGTTFKAGDTITVDGTGSDDKALPPGALRWDVVFLHDQHTHPVMEDVTGATISLPIATTGHGYEGTTGYQVTLRVTDADGLSASTSIRLVPRKVEVLLETNVATGGPVVVDGINQVLPFTIDALEAFELPVEVPAAVCSGGRSWRFNRWSNGATRAFTLTVPAASATLSATYDDTGSSCGSTVPGVPTGVGATSSGTTATVHFTPPADDGGSPITGYTARCTSPDGGTTRFRSGTGSPLAVGSLTAEATYTCRVRATNAVGSSVYSAASNPIPDGATVKPEAPTGVTVSLAGTTATVSFSPPPSDGGTPITGYKARCLSSNGGTSRYASGTASPIAVTSLTRGATYTCQVSATNSVGTSAYSAASTAFTVP